MSEEPEFIFGHVDGKVQIYSVVKGVKLFPDVEGDGQSARNFVAEAEDEEAAHDLLDRIGVKQSQRPERKK